MNVRSTVIFVVAALVAGTVVILDPFDEREQEGPGKPWFYQVSVDEIETIAVTHDGQRIKFVRSTPHRFLFEDPSGVPPDETRFGGIPLLASGPRAKRELSPSSDLVEARSEYGLQEPETTISLGLSAGRSLEFRLGDKTSDGRHHYGEVAGLPGLFLIASSWGDVLARLADEPPLPKWYVERDPEDIVQLNLSLRDVRSDASVLRFRNIDGEWTVRHTATGDDAKPVDIERWSEIMPLLRRPADISVSKLEVEDSAYSDFGIDDDSSTIELRFLGMSTGGTEFIDRLTLKIGDKTQDGRRYYAMVHGSDDQQPVLAVSSEWVDRLLGLFDNIPYAADQ